MKMDKKKLSFKGWSLEEFVKGRKKLLITLIGAVAAFIITNKPELAVLIGAISELGFAVIEYFVKER